MRIFGGRVTLGGREVTGLAPEPFELFPLLRRRRRHRVGSMSGGERQMVAVGQALMLKPYLLLGNLSAGLAPVLVTLFERTQAIRYSGVAIVTVEQNARPFLELADRAYALAPGRNRFEGPGVPLLNDPDVGRLYLGGEGGRGGLRSASGGPRHTTGRGCPLFVGTPGLQRIPRLRQAAKHL